MFPTANDLLHHLISASVGGRRSSFILRIWVATKSPQVNHERTCMSALISTVSHSDALPPPCCTRNNSPAQREERQRHIKLHMHLLQHASMCEDRNCQSKNCSRMKVRLEITKYSKRRFCFGCGSKCIYTGQKLNAFVLQRTNST